MVPLLGWKQECGSAGLAAAEAATDAALALVQRLGQQGRPAVVKVRAAVRLLEPAWVLVEHVLSACAIEGCEGTAV
jgi:hypothetical protein